MCYCTERRAVQRGGLVGWSLEVPPTQRGTPHTIQNASCARHRAQFQNPVPLPQVSSRLQLVASPPDAMPVPVIVGVAQIRNKSKSLSDAKEPLVLIRDAVELAIQDTNAPDPSRVKAAIDDVVSMAITSWQYEDPVEQLVGMLGLHSSHVKTKVLSLIGGNTPPKHFDEAARRIATGVSSCTIIGGAESWYSLNAWANQKKSLPQDWTKPPPTKKVAATSRERDFSGMSSSYSARHGITKPIQFYPLFELAHRKYTGKTQAQAQRESAEIYAEFSKIAQTNEGAWSYGDGAMTAEQIAKVGPDNRMICYPYPLRMNALMQANQSCAAGGHFPLGLSVLLSFAKPKPKPHTSFLLVMMSTEMATKLGVPKSKWIYIHGGAGGQDSKDVLERSCYYRSFAMEQSFEAAVAVSGLKRGLAEIDLIDLYSCFPIMVKLSATHLKIDPRGTDKPLSLCGGNTFFGGLNYAFHGTVAMVRALRAGRGKVGLVHGNGEMVTKHHVIILGTEPRQGAYPAKNPLPEMVPPEFPPPKLVVTCPKTPTPATIETYTIEYDRVGNPLTGWVIGRLENGERFLSNVDVEKEKATVKTLVDDNIEPIGMKGWVWNDGTEDGGRNWFRLGEAPKL